MSFYIFFKENEKLSMEILPNGKRHTFFFVFLQILLLIYKIKAKFLVGENKYMCRYCKI